MLGGFVEHGGAVQADDRRGDVGELGVATRLGPRGETQREQFRDRDHVEDIPRVLAEVLVLDHGVAHAGDPLHRAMRVDARLHGDRGGDGAEQQQRGGRVLGEGEASGEGDQTERDAHQQQDDGEMDDLRVVRGEVRHWDNRSSGNA